MRQISRRELYALGEPIGDSATYERQGDRKRVMGGGGGGGPTTIENWDGIQGPMTSAYTAGLSAYFAEQTADKAAAASIQAGNLAAYTTWVQAQKTAEFSLWQAATIAVKTAIDLEQAKIMRNRMREIAADQYALGDRQIKMGEQLHARYLKTFTPVEDAYADFAKVEWDTNRYKPNYNLQQGRARLDAAREYRKAASKLNKRMTRYNTGSNAQVWSSAMSDWARREADLMGKAQKDEQIQMWRRDDVQWARLQSAIAIGQKLPTQAARDLEAGIQTATESLVIKGQAMQTWNYAVSKSVGGVFRAVNTEIEARRANSMSEVAAQARAAFTYGSLGSTGLQSQSLGLSPNAAVDYSGAGFSSLRAYENSVSITTSDATGAVQGG
jgi:hypothetical protein